MRYKIYSSIKQQIDSIVANITQTVSQLLLTQTNVTIAVSGGKSPILMFEKLSISNIDFSKVTFTLVDERMVDTANLDSNENLVRQHLLKNNALVANFIGLYNKETHNTLISKLNFEASHIDIAILGMGEDGHTASIFPECKELQTALDLTNPNTYILTTPLYAQHPRISLTLSAILKIPYLILSISGDTKIQILNKALFGDTLEYPISYILTRKPTTQIFCSK